MKKINVKKVEPSLDELRTPTELIEANEKKASYKGVNLTGNKNDVILISEFPFILQKIFREEFTDISFIGGKLILRGTEKGIYEVGLTDIEKNELYNVCKLISIRSKTAYGIENPYLDTEVYCQVDDEQRTKKKLRAAIYHSSIMNEEPTKDGFKLRYNNPSKSLTDQQIFDMFADYKVDKSNKIYRELSEEQEKIVQSKLKKFNDLINLNKRPTIVIGGATGTGKTEIQKLLVNQIPDFIQSIVSIADTNDASLKELYPNKDILELFGDGSYEDNASFTMDMGIRAGLRSNPDWILIAEIRDREIKEFVKAIQTSHPGITTIHGSSSESIIDRMHQLYKSATKDTTIQKEQIAILIDYVIVVDKKKYYDDDDNVMEYRYIKEFKKYDDGGWVNA